MSIKKETVVILNGNTINECVVLKLDKCRICNFSGTIKNVHNILAMLFRKAFLKLLSLITVRGLGFEVIDLRKY